jgi:hypothetical protein
MEVVGAVCWIVDTPFFVGCWKAFGGIDLLRNSIVAVTRSLPFFLFSRSVIVE